MFLVSGQDFLSGTSWREVFLFLFSKFIFFFFYENTRIVRGKCTSMLWEGHSMSARRKRYGSRARVQ
jgi:hypothetical protein